jgi:hypothetical protein
MQSVAFWRRLAMSAVWGLQLLAVTSASAQVASECELRIGSRSVGGSLSLPLAEANVDYGPVSDSLWTELNTVSGRGWSAEAAVPIMRGWGARVDYTRGHLAVERSLEMSTAPYSTLERTREGSVTVRQLTAAVVRAKSPPGMLCAYIGAGAGLYQFDYRGQRARNGGLFGLGGIEFPVGERSGLGFEIQLHLAHNNYEGALRAETVVMLKPAVVFRVHF